MQATAKVGLIDEDLIGNLYDISRTSLSTFLLVSDITIRSIISNYLSSQNISLHINDHIMRLICQQNLIHIKFNFITLHQDYPYNQGSKKSLTIYVPLQSGTLSNGGTLEVAYGSHHYGLHPHIFRKQPLLLGKKKRRACL